jgi:hypothetical protein
VYGALTRDYLTMGANLYRKSLVLQQVGGLGFLSCGYQFPYCTVLEFRGSRVRVPMRTLDFFNLPNPSSTMDPRSTKPLTEMSTKNLPGGKGRPALKAENLTAFCEPFV